MELVVLGAAMFIASRRFHKPTSNGDPKQTQNNTQPQLGVSRGQERSILEYMGVLGNTGFERHSMETEHPSVAQTSGTREIDHNHGFNSERDMSLDLLSQDSLQKAHLHPVSKQAVAPMNRGFHYGATQIKSLQDNSDTKNTSIGGIGAPGAPVASQALRSQQMTHSNDNEYTGHHVSNARSVFNYQAQRPTVQASCREQTQFEYKGPTRSSQEHNFTNGCIHLAKQDLGGIAGEFDDGTTLINSRNDTQ